MITGALPKPGAGQVPRRLPEAPPILVQEMGSFYIGGETVLLEGFPARARVSTAGGNGGEKKQVCKPFARRRNTKIHALADARGRLIAILLTEGEPHDCPVADRLIRRAKPAKRMLGGKAYDSAELCEELDDRGANPVIPNRCTGSSRSASASTSTGCAGASRVRSKG
jgi:Transposase DDE domain